VRCRARPCDPPAQSIRDDPLVTFSCTSTSTKILSAATQAVIEKIDNEPASSLGHDWHARSYGVNAKRSQPVEELQDGRSRNAPKDHSQWNSLPKDKRQTAEQATAFARKAVEENELQRSHGAFRSAANTNDQAIGRRFWKYLSIAKQATAAKRCLSVCPLRMKLR
jgi:hypothetical protein